MKKRGFGSFGKKGDEEVLNLLVSLILLVMITFTYMLYLNSIKDQTGFRQGWLGEDQKLLVAAISAGPGIVENFVYSKEGFDIKVYKYIFSGQNKLLIVKPKIGDDSKEATTSITYIDKASQPASGVNAYASAMLIKETKEVITISEGKP
ncbi:MAG: hypothetical protein QF632_00340 [Candidatus Woesearchaeota archaeon]|nr:hypothetical protein [Candidatus Woesearchaeota archaeon]